MSVDYLIVGTFQSGIEPPFKVNNVQFIYRDRPDTADILLQIIKSAKKTILNGSSNSREGFWLSLSVTKHPHLPKESDSSTQKVRDSGDQDG